MTVHFRRSCLWLVQVLGVLALVGALGVATVLVVLAMTTSVANWRALAVTSGSMSPAVEAGDAIMLEQVDVHAVEPGDIITYSAPHAPEVGLTTHRVVAVREVADKLYFQTKGDANADTDPDLIPADAVHGRVARTLPYGGYALATLSRPATRVLVVVVPLIAMLAFELVPLLPLRRRHAGVLTSSMLIQRMSGLKGRTGARTSFEGQPLTLKRVPRQTNTVSCGIGLSVALGLALVASASASVIGTHASFVDTTPLGNNSFAIHVLAVPADLSATVLGADVRLDWTATASPRANGHRVYRAPVPGGPYMLVEEITPPDVSTYTDSPGSGTHYYMVRAFYEDWESADGNEVEVVVP